MASYIQVSIFTLATSALIVRSRSPRLIVGLRILSFIGAADFVLNATTLSI